MSRRQRRALFQCGRCRKRYSNPFGHTCAPKSDFKRRKATAAKQAAAAKRKARPEHPPASACRDGDCRRAACAAYREGREHGYQEGHETGFAEGFAAGVASAS